MGVIKCFNEECHYHDFEEPDNCSHSFVEIQKCINGIIKKEGPIKSKNFYYRELKSSECFCGKSKKPRHSFCVGCYRELPRDKQKNLYQKIGEGYELAYEEAVKWLSY